MATSQRYCGSPWQLMLHVYTSCTLAALLQVEFDSKFHPLLSYRGEGDLEQTGTNTAWCTREQYRKVWEGGRRGNEMHHFTLHYQQSHIIIHLSSNSLFNSLSHQVTKPPYTWSFLWYETRGRDVCRQLFKVAGRSSVQWELVWNLQQRCSRQTQIFQRWCSCYTRVL